MSKTMLKRFILLGLLGMTISCSRSVDQTSTVSLSVPSLSKASTLSASSKLAHLVINISGPGINSPILYTWDSKDDAAAVAPESLELVVPRGNNRLVQVLAVYKADSGMTFFYGDQEKTFSSANESVGIAVVKIGVGQVIGGQVVGRYQNTDSSFPNGPVTVKYFPPGRPGLIIDRSYIHNGWFSLFALSGAQLGYELATNGALLWGKPVGLADTEFNTSSTLMKVGIPTAYRNESWSGSSSWRLEEAQVFAYGFFGNTAYTSAKCIQRASTMTSLGRITPYVATAPANGSSPDGMEGSVISGTFASAAELASTTTPMSSYVVKGGQTSCAGTENLDFLDLSALSTLINGNGKDGAAYLYPPLKGQANGSSRSAMVLTSIVSPVTGYRLSGEFLNGIYPTSIDSVKIYKRVSSDNWSWENDGAPCLQAEKGWMGFVDTNATFSATSGDQFQIDVPISAAETSTGLMLAVCYSKGSQLIGAGYIIRKDWFSSPNSPTAMLSISDGPSYSFGNVDYTGGYTYKIFTVTNSGSVTATSMSGPTLAAGFSFYGGAYPGSSATCGTNLAPGATCTVNVKFAPNSQVPYSGSLNINYHNGSSMEVAQRGLSGAGVPP